jgi:hypothetical protein
LFNKPDTALVQMGDASQATAAMKNLNHPILFGKAISIALSKYTHVRLSRSVAAGGVGGVSGNGINAREYSDAEPMQKTVARSA